MLGQTGGFVPLHRLRRANMASFNEKCAFSDLLVCGVYVCGVCMWCVVWCVCMVCVCGVWCV